MLLSFLFLWPITAADYNFMLVVLNVDKKKQIYLHLINKYPGTYFAVRDRHLYHHFQKKKNCCFHFQCCTTQTKEN